MAEPGRPTQADYRRHLALAAALVTLVGALGSLGEAAEWEGLWIASAVILIIGASAVAWWTIRDELAKRRQQREDVFERIITGRGSPERVPMLEELTPYDLGADEEALGGEDTPTEYLPRDKDDDLAAALVRARKAAEPRMVVLRGPSKSGKSRTLYEVVKRDRELRHASVLAPRDIRSLAALLEDGRPAPRTGRLLLWLDDLERFISPGHAGMDRDALTELAEWKQPIVVVATAGGKGADQHVDDGLAVPIQQLFSHRRVESVSLRSELSPQEQVHVRERFPAHVAQQVADHGIGEYLVAAPELARKLDTERHGPLDDECPEGAAVAWAAIDWARSGMTQSISEPLLRAIWPHYLRGLQPTDERFRRGLDWALRPVYRSVALVYERNSYEAYDWIVAHAEKSLRRSVNIEALERIIQDVDPEAAFDLAVAAYGKAATDQSRRAFQRGAESSDDRVAATSSFNLGYLLAEQGDLDGARDAYERALRSAEPEPAAMAGLNLGILLQQHGDDRGAADAYARAMALRVPGHSATAALNLGALRGDGGDVEGARAAFEEAARSDDEKLACRAAFLLGTLLHEHGVPGAAAAFERALASTDADVASAAALGLGEALEATNPARARFAYERAAASGHSALATIARAKLATLSGASSNGASHGDAQAAFRRASELEENGDADGAREAYEALLATGDHDFGAAAAFGLAVLLDRQHDSAGARRAYERAMAHGHPTIGEAAALGLGELLARLGDPGARELLERAAAARDPDIATAAKTTLEGLE